jgi:hypothetical protein
MDKQRMKAFLRDQQGSILTLLAASMMMVVGFTGLAVDAGYLYALKSKVQATADAAAFAAASQLNVDEASVTIAAMDYAGKNMPAADHGTVLTNADVVLGNWDGDTRTFIRKGKIGEPGNACSNPMPQEMNPNCLPLNAVKVTIRRAQANGNPVQLFFASVLGFNQVDVEASAIASGDRTVNMELALVLDVSGSMSGDMDDLKIASQELIDQLFGAAETLPNVWVAVLPFSGRVNILDYGATWMQNWPSGDATHLCVGLRSMPYQANDAPPSTELFPDYVLPKSKPTCPEAKVLGLTAEKSTIKSHISAMTSTHGTSTQRGLVWGWRALSPEWQGQWGNAELPNPYNGPIPKVVIIMTDGQNHPGQSDDPYTTEEVDQILLQECAEMKASGITIFSVVFKASNLLQLYTECASPGKAFKVTNAAGLFEAFTQIGGALLGARLLQ